MRPLGIAVIIVAIIPLVMRVLTVLIQLVLDYTASNSGTGAAITLLVLNVVWVASIVLGVAMLGLGIALIIVGRGRARIGGIVVVASVVLGVILSLLSRVLISMAYQSISEGSATVQDYAPVLAIVSIAALVIVAAAQIIGGVLALTSTRRRR